MNKVTIHYLLPYIKSSIDKVNNSWKPNIGAWGTTVRITLTSLFKHLYIMILAYPEFVVHRKKFRETLYLKAVTIVNKTDLEREPVYYYAKKVKESCDTLLEWEKHLGVYNRLLVAGVRDIVSQKISSWLYPRETIYYENEGLFFRICSGVRVNI